ncbi:sugar porter family MFS transporter [Actinomyces bowdenii]|uniref:MFS transporter n=1 Tax=Actinomyces bowdenii TaxID=131109 RepID=A0A3P1V0Q3_9ACTO|nr:sugar porter family MFS transporter [Actinomyces bowdenii]MBO3723970.1 sugar porter family MFS transporter [Actinomyces bowdenii]RRD27277.1 MFS transporter [Actinomyces bowdenii]
MPSATSSKISPLVIRSAIVAALGGLLFGFDTAVISGTTNNLRSVFDLSEFGLGFTVATALIGTIIGAMSAGRPADIWGRKNILLTIGLLYTVSALGSALVSDWYLFMFFRLIGGIGVGGASVVAPIYTAEISPARVRGRLVGLVQFNVVLGILLAYLSNYVLAKVFDYEVAWRWMFGIEAVPAMAFLLLALTIPESPRWLYGKGRTELARSIVERLTSSRQEADFEIGEIEQALKQDASMGKAPFFVPRNYRVILLAFAIAAFNQLSGINAIMYYAPDIFRMAGAGSDTAFLSSIAVGAMNLIATMTALTVIDKFGRRKLMIVGSIGYLISLGSIAVVFFMSGESFSGGASTLVLLSLLVFIAAHAFGQGSVIWVFISEIFPSRIRARGQALGSFTHWFFAAVISWSFPAIAGGLGGGWAFTLFLVCMVGQLIWVLTTMPETKGVPLEEMEERLGLGSGH